MKKNMFYTAALLLAGAVMAACSGSEDIMGNNTAEPQAPTEKGAVVLSGTLGSKGSKDNETRGYMFGASTNVWEVGDEFAIYYATTTGHATAVATVNSVNESGSANFTATLYNPKAGDNDAILVYPASLHDGQGGIKADALNEQSSTQNNSYIDIEKKATTLSVEEQDGKASKATLNSDVTMEIQVCYLDLYLKKSNGTPLLPKKLVVSDGTHSYTVTPKEDKDRTRVTVWPADGVNLTFTATVEETIYTKLDNVTLTNCGLEHIGCVFDKDGNVYSASKGSEIIYSASYSNKTWKGGTKYHSPLTLTSSATNDDITPVAMIAYVGSHGSVDDSSTDQVTGYHGLAIAMENSYWFNAGSDNYKGIDGEEKINSLPSCIQISEACTPECDGVSYPIAQAREFKNGITMTSYLIEHSTGNHDHRTAKAAKDYNVPVPTGTSGWFLPSIGQWGLIAQGLITKQDNLSELYSTPLTNATNAKMKKSYFRSIYVNAGADEPWNNCISCTFYCDDASSEFLYAMNFANGRTNQYWLMTYANVRSVLAF